MRTTVKLDSDIEMAVEQLRAESGLGLSEAINELARRGLATRRKRRTFKQRTSSLGVAIDVSNVAEALELLEGSSHR